MEVIYTGIRQTSEAIVRAALQEDAEVIGLSILSGAHLTHCKQVIELLHSHGMGEVLVVVGGIIPKREVPVLKEMGVAGVFGPGTPIPVIVDFLRQEVANRRKWRPMTAGPSDQSTPPSPSGKHPGPLDRRE